MKPGDLVFARGQEIQDSNGKSIVDYCELFRDSTSPGDPGEHTFIHDGTPLLVIMVLPETIHHDESVKTLEVFEFEMSETWLVFDNDVRQVK